jgi:thiol-disulfide isomerase/thioredoxin
MYFSFPPAASAFRALVLSCLAAALCLLLLVVGLPVSQAKIKIGNFPKDSVAKHPLRTLDGREYSLAGLRGQVVVLEFLAVWCVHSRDQVPALNKFDEEDRERGLKIIGLILNDTETTMPRIQQFTKDQKIEFPLTTISYDLFEKFVESKDTAVPQTLIYGRNGKLAGYFAGHNNEIAEQLTTLIKQELDKKL